MQRDLYTDLLKQAKREALLQKRHAAEQARLEQCATAYNAKYQAYLQYIEQYNHILGAYNSAVNTANVAYNKAAVHATESAMWHNHYVAASEASQMLSAQMWGTGGVTSTIAFSGGISPQNGLTLTANHSISRGNMLLASASTSYNSHIAQGQKINATLAMAQARADAAVIPTTFRQPFADLQQFIEAEAQYLQGFELPQFSTSNPYQQPNKILFNDTLTGNNLINQHGIFVVEDVLFTNQQPALQKLGFSTQESFFKLEPDSSFWSVSATNLNNNWQPAIDTINKNNSYWNRFVSGVNWAVGETLAFVTGSSSAQASPLVASGAFANPATVAPVAATSNNNVAPATFKQLGTELLDVAKKSLMLANLLASPNPCAKDVYQILVTPMHELKPSDIVLPGGLDVSKVDTEIPAYGAHDGEEIATDTGHAIEVPNYEDISVPPLQAYDGEPLLFMFENPNKVEASSLHADESAGKTSIFVGETEAYTIFSQSGSKNINSAVPRKKLYRAVNENELAQMHQSKKIEQGANSLEGKFFAESYDDAKKWGELMNGTAIVIEVDIPATVFNELQHWKKLDGIGPARYALLEHLEDAIVKMPRKVNFTPEPNL